MKALALAAALLAKVALAQASASAQTFPIPTPTAANDTAIWVHPTEVGRSLVFGTDQFGTGLTSYFLDGGIRELVNIGPTRAVDVRYGLKLGTKTTDVVLSVGINGGFRLLGPDATGVLTPIDTAFTNTGSNANAAALYFNPVERTLMIFVSDFAGNLRHYRAVDDGQGKLATTLLRTLTPGGTVDGIAADDRGERLFVTIANRGLFVLDARDGASTVPGLVESLDAGRLVSAKGVALYFTADGGGYVIASSSASSRFPVYALSTGFPFITSFNLVTSASGPGATNSAGIDVVPLPLGPPFTSGMFIAHDPNNLTGPNYKLVKWDAIALSATPTLAVDPRFDPRAVASDAGVDAGAKCPIPGADSGVADAGDAGADAGPVADAGVDPCSGAGGGGGGGGTSTGVGGGFISGGGGGAEQPSGCSCASPGLLFPLAAFGLLLLWRRRP